MFVNVLKTVGCLSVALLLTAGCTGGAPAPEEDQVLQDSASFVWTFIHEAQQKKSKPEVIQQKLSIMMEALDAQAEANGGKLVQLRDDAKELQAALQAGKPAAESVQQFADKVAVLVPEPQSMEP